MSDRRTTIMEAAARVIARRGVRGLRVEELAAEAGVSTGLVYYHFKDRTGVLRATLAFINDRADRYTTERDADEEPAPARDELTHRLLLELQDTPEVRENSVAWGELCASAVFDESLREDLTKATDEWSEEIGELVADAIPTAPLPATRAAAERLTALLEGLSGRWLSGLMSVDRARDLMSEAIAVELDRLEHTRRPAEPGKPLGA
ncbi:TetR/AcrR family transcriptional regulator [Embleya hyalina]|uniref:Putative transcriptional regulator, TetR family protein n=1 Tax=Embleya hyalina TaxID=516124 RepID=A0A401YK43_9ACTN|nr:TetR/AcrR family transcriptional regulator [Embleya hyalina]GCD94966.1 putative transcriptional regulator, TetR family protein [Embleya hyalina]